jgi:hypothetical protein
MAEDVLIEAQTAFDYNTGHGPIAVYVCDDCGYYHLTSKGPMNDRLSQYIASGKLARQKEANRWADKWRGKQ